MASDWIQGSHYSGSFPGTTGSTIDVVAQLETFLGVPHLVIKKMTISASSLSKFRFNDEPYWSTLLSSGSMFALALNAGDVMISNMYFNGTTGSNVNIDIIY
jgi:hypothetical protein